MDLSWFYIVVALAASDVFHTQVMWKIANNFYILLGGLIHEIVNTPLQTWLVHETLEASFHFIVLSILFLNFKIGIMAALVHYLIDITHNLIVKKSMNEIEHRALHFLLESLFFMIIAVIT